MIPGEQKPKLAELTETQREQAMIRFTVLRPHLDSGVPLSQAAQAAGVPVRTARHWLARYRTFGLVGLARLQRSDVGQRKLGSEFVELIEGMFLRKPRPSVATIHRRVVAIARERNWPAPSYSSIHSITRHLDPAIVTLAHDGQAAFRDRFELVYRHRAARPNMLWQADHTELDIFILDAAGRVVRPWMTTVIDDHSRVLAGYLLFLGAPSALQTSLALRQAIWRKDNPAWQACGIPDVLYVDHGSDFTSHHLEQVAADLHFQLVFSIIARPQGRGKVERLFLTLNTEVLPELPGHLVHGKAATPPKLSLSELDRKISAYVIDNYNVRKHGEIDAVPQAAWLGQGWIPRMPNSLEDLDLLLIMVAKPRVVLRDGIHFQGLRYMDSTLAAYVGEPVTIRYDPRDLGEIRVFHRNRFLCRAISPEHCGQAITLKDIQTARTKYRRSLRGTINERITRVTDFLSVPIETPPQLAEKSANHRRTLKLRTYLVDGE